MGKRGRPKKKPGHKASPPSKSIRASQDPEAVRKSNPVWSFQWLDRTGPWSWDNASKAELLSVIARLQSLESMTWAEIDELRSSGFMLTSQLSRNAQVQLVESKRDDVEQLYKLRVDKSARIWGIRQGSKFRILWWDPKHTVYPMDITGNRN